MILNISFESFKFDMLKLIPCLKFGAFFHGILDVVLENVSDKDAHELDNKAVFESFEDGDLHSAAGNENLAHIDSL